nr:putative ribonuclease H-like domain-containing protein [Tanacetum cinerariifolium]
METTISASPTPTLRIYKDHPKSQIIGPIDTPIQTRHKSKEVEEQSFIATIYQKTDPALLQFCLFSCFLSQVKPKKISDALQDPSWVEAMQEFEALMHEKFQMIAMGELNFFLGLQVLQKDDGIFLSQDKHQVTPKECHLHVVKRIFRYLKGHPKLGLWYPKESPFDLVAYSDSDYGGASQDRKSTTEEVSFWVEG